MTPSPRDDLRREMIQRTDQGWDVEGALGHAEMTMTHVVHPPAWRVVLEMLNPLTWLAGPSLPRVTRRLRV